MGDVGYEIFVSPSRFGRTWIRITCIEYGGSVCVRVLVLGRVHVRVRRRARG
jgi:hypothetical protein